MVTKASAAAACFASSAVSRRTSTFVSTARMPGSHSFSNPLTKGTERATLRRRIEPERRSRIVQAVLPRLSHDDLSALLIPFDHGTRPETELAAHLGWNGNLPL